jgi:hypothetical protein
MAASMELSEYKLDLLDILGVRWMSGGTEQAGE